MNFKSKIVSFSTATIFTLAFAGQCIAASNSFTDLTDVTAKEKILALQEKGYVKGTGNSLFAPNGTITAAQGIQLIVNALELNLDRFRFIKEPKATDYFKKANDNAWYASALIVASVNGLELPADLDPSEEWTREEFTFHLIQAVESQANLPMVKIAPIEFADRNQLTDGYDGSIQRALAYSVVKLDSESKFNPKDNITRADAAEQVYNIIEYIEAHPAPAIDKRNQKYFQ